MTIQTLFKPDGPLASHIDGFKARAPQLEMAEAVAPVIYGTRIDCAQCHDHPLAREIRQAHYWALVAAFNRSRRAGSGVVVEESAIGGHLNFTNLKKESQPALLEVLGGPVIQVRLLRLQLLIVFQ